jgi:hypothetical protein
MVNLFDYNKLLPGVDSYVVSPKCIDKLIEEYDKTIFPTNL